MGPCRCLKTAGELLPGPSRESAPDKEHVLNGLMNCSSSLDKVVNTTAFILCLGGRIGKKIPENYNKKSLEAKYSNNPISAAEHKMACLRLIEHEQRKTDKGNISRTISDPGTRLKGATKELREVRQGWSKAELIRFRANLGLHHGLGSASE